jgi:WD40 repeat protein
MEFNADGSALATMDAAGRLILWDADTGDWQAFDYPDDLNYTLRYTPADALLVAGATGYESESPDNTIFVWNAVPYDPTPTHTFTGHQTPVTSVAFTPDGSALIASDGDESTPNASFYTWALDEDQSPRATISWTQDYDRPLLQATDFAFSPDGTLTAALIATDRVAFWSTPDLAGDMTIESAAYTLGFSRVHSIAFSPDGRQFVAIGSPAAVDSNVIRVWTIPADSARAEPPPLCVFWTDLDNVPLFDAPLTNGVNPPDTVLSVNVRYPILQTHFEHFLIQFDDTVSGWVDRRSGRTDGNNCLDIPEDGRSLVDFLSLCWFTNDSGVEQPAYLNPDSNSDAITIVQPAPTAYVVLDQRDGYYLLYYDHAFSAWVDASTGHLSGGCDDDASATGARVMAGANLWTAPDVKTGVITATIETEQAVTILDGPATGPIRADSDLEGAWYLIETGDGVTGWVWEGRLAFDSG